VRRLRDIPGALAALIDAVPKAGWLCALVGVLAGIAWAVIVPPFHVPDEPAHFAYTQYLAEAGEPPRGEAERRAYSQEELRVLDALRYKQVEVRPDNRPLNTARAQRQIERALDVGHSRRSAGGYSHANSNPPLYYALEVVPYRLTPSGNLLDRLFAMRTLSALLAGLTVLFIFLFLRELLPSTPWVWTVGALAVALQPLLGNVSGAIHSDNLLYPASAGVFLGFARSFRRGLTLPLGVLIGLCAAAGVLAKPSGVAFVPGVALGILLLVLRAGPERRRAAIAGAAGAAVCALLPVITFVLLNSGVWDRGGYTSGDAEPGRVNPTDLSLFGYVEYVWQFYLPRLPFMADRFDGYPLADIWLDGFVGRFGALEYDFGTVVDVVAAVVLVGILALAIRELVRSGAALRSRALELATYAALTLGLLYVIHYAGYTSRTEFYDGFEQARYLFPLLALYAAIVALASRGAGRRLGPAAGVLIVSLAVAHTLLALLLTLTRYYG
jgi:Predicted membrane protein (DUF2142)